MSTGSSSGGGCWACTTRLLKRSPQERLFEAMAAPQERERFAELVGVRLFTPGATQEQIESRRALLEERRDLWTRLIDRAVGSPCVGALEQVDRVSALLDGLWQQDRANYRMALHPDRARTPRRTASRRRQFLSPRGGIADRTAVGVAASSGWTAWRSGGSARTPSSGDEDAPTTLCAPRLAATCNGALTRRGVCRCAHRALRRRGA